MALKRAGLVLMFQTVNSAHLQENGKWGMGPNVVNKSSGLYQAVYLQYKLVKTQDAASKKDEGGNDQLIFVFIWP